MKENFNFLHSFSTTSYTYNFLMSAESRIELTISQKNISCAYGAYKRTYPFLFGFHVRRTHVNIICVQFRISILQSKGYENFSKKKNIFQQNYLSFTYDGGGNMHVCELFSNYLHIYGWYNEQKTGKYFENFQWKITNILYVCNIEHIKSFEYRQRINWPKTFFCCKKTSKYICAFFFKSKLALLYL